MGDSKTHLAAPTGFFARLGKARERSTGQGGSSRAGHGPVLSFRRPEVAAEDQAAGGGLFVAHATGLMPRDPVAHPKFRPRLEGAVQKIYHFTDDSDPSAGPAVAASVPTTSARKAAEVDIAAFVEAVSAAYPQPRDPDVRPVLKARLKEAARPFVYLPGSSEEPGAEPGEAEPRKQAWDAEAMQRAHTERELKAFHEFLDRMESVPLEALDHPLADLDEKAEARRQFAGPVPLYDPILEAGAVAYASCVAREAPPVPEEDRPVIVEAVIEPQDPVAKPRLPHVAEVLGGVPQRLSPSQRAHLKRPATVRDMHGRIAPVTYSINPRNEE